MKLTDLNGGITPQTKAKWEDLGYALPAFDREALRASTRKAPTWLHFGAGNIFRAFPAAVLQGILNKGEYDRGVIVCEGFDTQIIRKAYEPYDALSLLCTLKGDGSVEKTVIGSVTEAITGSQIKRLTEIFTAASLQMVSFTITEKGYAVRGGDGELSTLVQQDLDGTPEDARHLMGKLTHLLFLRWKSGAQPISLVSMDNCSHNGDKLRAGVLAFADGWIGQGKLKKGFGDWLRDADKVAFPLSMIDKITPRPDQKVRALLEKDGFADTELIVTEKNTYTAPFVNAEEAQYLVIENAFPNGRPPLEKGGVLFTDRETVDKVEKMKVCTCLNPLHTALAIFGCLLGYTLICDEMKDEQLCKLVTRLGYEEGMRVVVDPGVLDPKAFLQQVLQTRLVNPFMPDSPQRIATDTSQKLSIRFGETIKAYRREGYDLNDLKMLPLVLAGYLRYLCGIDDAGEAFTPSPDPMLTELMQTVNGSGLERTANRASVRRLLSREDIFGVDLEKAGLASRVMAMFEEMLAGKGAVRATLVNHV